MVKIDALIFGYRRLKIAPDDLSLFSSLLLRASIPSVINNDGTITVRERDFDKTCNIISGRMGFSYSEPLGLYGWWKRLKYKKTIMISLVISIFMLIFLSGLVWDIRVEGNVEITDTEIIIGLKECGFKIGDSWKKTDRSSIETQFLERCSNLAWININRRGTVAYVKVIEKEINSKDENQLIASSNLISTADCVIEEITVKRGIAMVKPGDTVKKGDILVLGALPSESGGGFCAADATVIGRVSETVAVDVARNYQKKIESKKTVYSFDVNFFKFSINIFKRYRNLTNDCVIIENEVKCSLFGIPLPLSVTRRYLVEYVFEDSTYSDDEIAGISFDRLNQRIASRLESSDLIRIKTSGDFTDDGYRAKSEIVFLADVTDRVVLEIEK